MPQPKGVRCAASMPTAIEFLRLNARQLPSDDTDCCGRQRLPFPKRSPGRTHARVGSREYVMDIGAAALGSIRTREPVGSSALEEECT